MEWKFIQINRNQWKSIEFHRNQWKSIEIIRYSPMSLPSQELSPVMNCAGSWQHWHQILFEYGHIFGAENAERRATVSARRPVMTGGWLFLVFLPSGNLT